MSNIDQCDIIKNRTGELLVCFKSNWLTTHQSWTSNIIYNNDLLRILYLTYTSRKVWVSLQYQNKLWNVDFLPEQYPPWWHIKYKNTFQQWLLHYAIADLIVYSYDHIMTERWHHPSILTIRQTIPYYLLPSDHHADWVLNKIEMITTNIDSVCYWITDW